MYDYNRRPDICITRVVGKVLEEIVAEKFLNLARNIELKN